MNLTRFLNAILMVAAAFCPLAAGAEVGPETARFTRAEIDAMIERGEVEVTSSDRDGDGLDDLVVYTLDDTVLKLVEMRHRRTEPVPGFEDVTGLGINRIERRSTGTLYFRVRNPELIGKILSRLCLGAVRVVGPSTWYHSKDRYSVCGGWVQVDNCDDSLYFYSGEALYRKLHIGIDLMSVENPSADRPGIYIDGLSPWLDEIAGSETERLRFGPFLADEERLESWGGPGRTAYLAGLGLLAEICDSTWLSAGRIPPLVGFLIDVSRQGGRAGLICTPDEPDPVRAHAVATAALWQCTSTPTYAALVPAQLVDDALSKLVRLQRPEGGWPSTFEAAECDLETTMWAACALGASREDDDPCILGALARVRRYFEHERQKLTPDDRLGRALVLWGACLAWRDRDAWAEGFARELAALRAATPHRETDSTLYFYAGSAAAFCEGGETWQAWHGVRDHFRLSAYQYFPDPAGWADETRGAVYHAIMGALVKSVYYRQAPMYR